MKIKNLLMLPILAGLMLVGCKNNKSEVKPSEPDSHEGEGGGSSSDPVEQGVSISFEAGVSYFASEGFADVEIPNYECASSSALLTQPDAESYPTQYVIKGSSSEEMVAYLNVLHEAGWTLFNGSSEGTYYADLYEVAAGESTPEIFIGDYTSVSDEAYNGIAIAFMIYTEPVPAAAFPLEEVNAYLTENEYGFTLSAANGEALSALSTSFVPSIGTYNNYPICQVAISGEILTEVAAILGPVATSASYVLYAEEDSYIQYVNMSTYCQVIIKVEDGYTYVIFY